MKRLITPSVIVSFIFLGIFLYVLIGAFSFSSMPRLFPLVVGGAGVVVVLFQIILGFRKAYRSRATDSGAIQDQDQGMAFDFEVTADETSREGVRITIEQFVWVFGLLLGLWLIGFYISVPIFVFAYLMRHGESWKLSGILGAIMAVVVWGLFHELLNLPFPEGVLVRLFPWD
jgi:hypothetical protein|tara:strand:- start:1045 stop:1563 length:519 start_codon:yes stop_codon:yes gene_type:complete